MSTPVGDHTKDELWVCRLGTIPYLHAVALQERLRALRQDDALPDTLLLLEHPPVYTRGRRSREDELALGGDLRQARAIEVVDTDRGGRVTYHGPGQLVGYPIMHVLDIGAHLATMEAAIVAALAHEGIAARSRRAEGPDYTGVWVHERKIASIGVHVSRGVSTHGFAVNVNNDLGPFSWVVACGLPGVAMTSLARELPGDRAADPAGFAMLVARCFCEAHGRSQRVVSPERLGIDAQPHARMRGRTPRTGARGSSSPCADATQNHPTPDIESAVVAGHAGPA